MLNSFIADGRNRFSLFLSNEGKLYGEGNNRLRQISDEDTDYFTEKVLIAEKVISASAGKSYTVYITDNGQIHIQGQGCLKNYFPNFFSASEVYASEGSDQFILIGFNGKAYAFGDNEGEEIQKRQKNIIFSKEHIPYKSCWDPYYSHGPWVTEYDDTGKIHERHWNETDTENYWKDRYFDIRGFYCGEDIYKKREQLLSQYGKRNIEWEIDFDVDFRENTYRDGDYYRQDFNGFSHIKFFKTNNWIFTPVPIEETCLFKLFRDFIQKDYPNSFVYSNNAKTKLFSSCKHLLILHNGNLYGMGSNSCGEISTDDVEEYTVPHLMAKNVISADAADGYSIYVTANGKVTLVGNGEYTDRFKGFSNARSVYVPKSKTLLFYIVDNNGFLYGFGDNSQNHLQKSFKRALLETKYDTVTYSDFRYKYYGERGFPTYKNTGTTWVRYTLYERPDWNIHLKEFYESNEMFRENLRYLLKKYGTNNIITEYEFTDEKVTISEPSHTTVRICDIKDFKENAYYPGELKKQRVRNLSEGKCGDFSVEARNTIYLTNRYIYNPVLITGKHINSAYPYNCFADWKYVNSDTDFRARNIKKTVRGYNTDRQEIGLLDNGKIVFFNKSSNRFVYARTPFEKVDDIVWLDGGFNFLSDFCYTTNFYAISSDNKVCFMEAQDLVGIGNIYKSYQTAFLPEK